MTDVGDVTVEQLITTKSEEDSFDDTVDIFEGAGFSVTSYQSGDLGLELIAAIAECWRRFSNSIVVASIRSRYNSTATGAALSLKSISDFDNTRIASVTTLGTVTLTDTTGDGPHSITNANVFKTADGTTFRSLTTDTLAQSGTLAVNVECETPGTVGNVANGAINALVTTITGVTVTNGVVGGPSWISRSGVDEESDSTLRARNQTKWPTLSPHGPQGAYVNFALNAVDGSGDPVGITRGSVDASNPDGPGTLRVYVANSTATATATQVADVQAYIEDQLSPGSTVKGVTTIAATEVPVNIAGTLLVTAGFEEAAETAVTEALTNYINSLPIGGFQLDGEIGGTGVVLRSKLIQLAMSQENVLRFEPSSPGSDVNLSISEVATVGTIEFTVDGI